MFRELGRRSVIRDEENDRETIERQDAEELSLLTPWTILPTNILKVTSRACLLEASLLTDITKVKHILTFCLLVSLACCLMSINSY